MFLQFSSLVNTDDFGAVEAENHDIYSFSVAFANKRHGICNAFSLRPSKKTGIYAVFSMLQDVVSTCGKRKNTLFLRCFCFSGAEKRVQKWLQNGHVGSKSGQLNPA